MQFSKLPLLGTLAMVGLMAIPAQAVVQVRITDSTGTYNFVGSPCGANTCVVANQTTAAFSVNLQIASSNAPAGPALLTVDGIVTSNTGSVATPNLLRIEASDTGFLLPSGTADLIQNVNTNSPALGAATGTVTATGYYDGGNVLYCQASGVCDGATPPANFGSFALATQTTQTTLNFTVPFSLDEVLMYSFTSSGAAQVTANLSSIAVPEPASVVLFGGVLLLTGILIRRRNRAAEDLS